MPVTNRILRRVFFRWALSLSLVAASWGLSIATGGVAAEGARTAPRKPAPAFVLNDADGKPQSLAQYKGKVVLLDIWATWCTGCKVEIPWYMEFQKKYQRQGLVSIGVAMDAEGWDAVTPYVRQHPFNYHIVVGGEGFAKLYDVTALPVTLLIDRRGRIADTHAGVVEKDAWEKEILKLLHERAN